MSAKDNPDAAPPGYRTLVPGKGVVEQGPKSAPKPAAKPGAPAAAQPAPAKPTADKPGDEKPHDDPTRYGDWEVKGRCIDF